MSTGHVCLCPGRTNVSCSNDFSRPGWPWHCSRRYRRGGLGGLGPKVVYLRPEPALGRGVGEGRLNGTLLPISFSERTTVSGGRIREARVYKQTPPPLSMRIKRSREHTDGERHEAGLYRNAIRIAGAGAIRLQNDQVVPTLNQRTMPVIADLPRLSGRVWVGNADGLPTHWNNAAPKHADDVVALLPSLWKPIRSYRTKPENRTGDKEQQLGSLNLRPDPIRRCV